MSEPLYRPDMGAPTHKQWLDNEYSQWVKALQESTVHNFKKHPAVIRMLGETGEGMWRNICDPIDLDTGNTIEAIETIGGEQYGEISGRCWRYIYYAQQILKRNPSSICEIGGGVGQFYAILRALGYNGAYGIIDLGAVIKFQEKYLAEVEKQTGLDLHLGLIDSPDLIVSFYALGEFDDETKQNYMWINSCPHGYIAFNPHSGASDDLSLFKHKHDIKVTPGIEPGVKIVEW